MTVFKHNKFTGFALSMSFSVESWLYLQDMSLCFFLFCFVLFFFHVLSHINRLFSSSMPDEMMGNRSRFTS